MIFLLRMMGRALVCDHPSDEETLRWEESSVGFIVLMADGGVSPIIQKPPQTEIFA
jgi:hypothetical protein